MSHSLWRLGATVRLLLLDAASSAGHRSCWRQTWRVSTDDERHHYFEQRRAQDAETRALHVRHPWPSERLHKGDPEVAPVSTQELRHQTRNLNELIRLENRVQRAHHLVAQADLRHRDLHPANGYGPPPNHDPLHHPPNSHLLLPPHFRSPYQPIDPSWKAFGGAHSLHRWPEARPSSGHGHRELQNLSCSFLFSPTTHSCSPDSL